MTNQYSIKLDKSNAEVSRYEGLINRYSVLRLLIVAAGIFLFYQSLNFEASWLPVLVFFLVIVIFSMLVRRQNFFKKRRNYFRDLSEVYRNEINSIAERQNVYNDGSKWADDLHPYTSDLDIFGKGSLFEFINRSATALGNNKLAGWLMYRSLAEDIRMRQISVEELSTKEDWKHRFQAMLLFSNQTKEDQVQDLFKYMRSVPGHQSPILKLYVKFSPFFFLLFGILTWFYSEFIPVIISLGIANWILTQAYSPVVRKVDSLIGKMSQILSRFSEAISAIRTEEWSSPYCLQLAAVLKDQEQGQLQEQIQKLSLLIKQLALGLSSIGPLLNFVIPWNVRYFLAIEDWKKANKVNLESAFDVIANFEALISLSSLRNNYPDWTFPVIIEKEHYTLSAESIGHPLISPQFRVANNFSLDNTLKIDIITGSNMAGKSTFLRTLGINTVLALSGAPVCAAKMQLSPILVFSYMRIKDSLNESTSTFKAELDRLKALLEILKTEDKVYFLIDEMLRGTNSVDKYLGSKGIIEKLISQNAVGIIATHDLQIAELEEAHPHYIRNFYFDIMIDDGEMSFDYKLKEGECKTFNASLLLRRLGLSAEGDNH